MRDDVKKAILAEVIALSVPPIRKEGDFTVAEYMTAVLEERGLDLRRQSAVAWLNALVEKGKLRSEIRLDPEGGQRRRPRVWWRIEEDETADASDQSQNPEGYGGRAETGDTG